METALHFLSCHAHEQRRMDVRQRELFEEALLLIDNGSLSLRQSHRFAILEHWVRTHDSRDAAIRAFGHLYADAKREQERVAGLMGGALQAYEILTARMAKVFEIQEFGVPRCAAQYHFYS